MNREKALARAIVGANRDLADSLGGKAWGPIANKSPSGVVASFDWAGYSTTLRAVFTDHLGKAAAAAAKKEAVRLERQAGLRKAKTGLAWGLDTTDPRMIDWAQRNAASLVTQVSGNTRQAIRDLVAESFRGRYTTVDLARQIRTLAGLAPRDATSIARNQASALLSLTEQGVPYPQAMERASTLASRMANVAVRRRAMTIARTEIIRASHQGTIEGWRQASDLGLIDSTARKTWIAFDPCDICQDLDGTDVPWEDDFGGEYDAPPAHPNCRCTVVMVGNGDASNPTEPVEG